MEQVEAIVIGAGVVGLAAARRLARAGCEVIVLEAADAHGTGISSRNSEVIHAGIYYPQGSLKARLCVAGKAALYEFCESRAVAHGCIGKLIVATSDAELAVLSDLETRAAINGVHDLIRLDATQAREMEPALHCRGALLSPSSGIVDGHGYMLALLGEIEAAFTHALERARDDGELPAGRDPRGLARRFTVIGQGLSTVGKLDPTGSFQRDAIASARALLDP